jgi:phosphohistidine phosphatase SixA
MLQRLCFHVVVGLLGLSAVTDLARADEAAAWTALRQGGHVALMRHAEAPGSGDPPGFNLEDCATQRNLSAEGRADARAIGARFRAERVAIGKLLSSPWCRCVDTARLMELGNVGIEPAFSNGFVLSDQRDALTEAGLGVVRAWTGPATLLIVTHGANIRALTGHSPASGEIVVVAPGADGMVRVVGRIPVPDA